MSSAGRDRGQGEAGRVVVENCQEVRPVGEEFMAGLERIGSATLQLIDERALVRSEIPQEISVSLLDDVMIGEVHGQYMSDPTPTDVITFPYGQSGEILISVETAEVQAGEYGVSWEHEMALYLVHGILHLCGYEDSSREGAARMSELQAVLLEEVLAGGAGSI